MKPFFTYYGGKYRLAPRYPQPKYNTIVEPFAGSAGYSCRYPHKNVFLLDKNPVIAGLWEFLIKVSEKEIENLPLRFDHVEEIAACQESKHLIGFWLNKGAAAPCKTPSTWMRSGIRPHSYWGETIRTRIASQLKEIRHWQIAEASFDDMPNVEATWFVDPPYQGSAGRHYKHNKIDFIALGDWCRERRGQTIVCENVGADWLPFESFLKTKGSSKDSVEALWHYY